MEEEEEERSWEYFNHSTLRDLKVWDKQVEKEEEEKKDDDEEEEEEEEERKTLLITTTH